ncbi:TIGR04283 family arsenosugar biosynthesis glycosyltransferase [Pelotalea chapellei]|uniref:TIGR04283 family arsenosugar biosynthesis glycosyltransferase n=1 Tax=Pelotalea chapellei TaxID=44671 RepID=A0ABS5U518_9BACT|nr:TIGR04283 family arsenosugar biosynthesis glycosyltransferase [Pelotalea chapellei]MBT1070748.1 TIGR04283 family arsenosugar biosynthesis glycosyltransferase [Pelotalea chapellei]
MPLSPKPDLSIIVPLLNEQTELPDLFQTLADQKDILFELLLCDGGSTDTTRQIAVELGGENSFTTQLLDTPPGRGRQMNAGAAVARADMLLFLHADSRFEAPDTLSIALQYLTSRQSVSTHPVAARFRLHFRRRTTHPSLAFYFYEAKACLSSEDCIRGDQGYMLSRSCFEDIGRFDDSLPFLEDLRLAKTIARQGSWLLLPVRITTSARRFETEGLLRRQIVNAVIVNAVAVGWNEFFRELPGLYRCHTETGKLLLFPLLDGIRILLASFTPDQRRTFWQATGRHVAANSWQIFFWLDARHAFHSSLPPESVRLQWTNRFNRYCAPFVCSSPVAWVASAAVRLWHRAMLLLCRRLEPVTKTS